MRSEVAKLTADDTAATAQAAVSKPDKVAQPPRLPDVKSAEKRLTHSKEI